MARLKCWKKVANQKNLQSWTTQKPRMGVGDKFTYVSVNDWGRNKLKTLEIKRSKIDWKSGKAVSATTVKRIHDKTYSDMEEPLKIAKSYMKRNDRCRI